MIRKSILTLAILGIGTSLSAITPELQKKVDDYFSQMELMITNSKISAIQKESVLQELKGKKIRVETLSDNDIEEFLKTGEIPKNSEISNLEKDTEQSWVGWVFGASEVAIDAFTTKGLSSGLATITGSFGPRYNFTKMAPSRISDQGFSVAGRLGFGVAALDNFHTTGFALPIEVEASYTINNFTVSGGLSFLIIPEIGSLQNFSNIGVYCDLGYAVDLFGAMSIRLGYMFYSSATLKMFNGQSINYDPLNGSFNFGVRWQF